MQWCLTDPICTAAAALSVPDPNPAPTPTPTPTPGPSPQPGPGRTTTVDGTLRITDCLGNAADFIVVPKPRL